MKQIALDDINLLDIGNTLHIDGVVWSGYNSKTKIPLSFITQLPGKTDTYNHTFFLPLGIYEWLRVIKQSDLVETEIVGKDENSKIIKTLVRKTQRELDDTVVWAVYQRDSYSCRYCGRTGVPLSIDHVILWEKGGPTIPDNLITACKSCNRTRGNLSYEEWLKSPEYLRRSSKLKATIRHINEMMVSMLPELEKSKVKNIRSRK